MSTLRKVGRKRGELKRILHLPTSFLEKSPNFSLVMSQPFPLQGNYANSDVHDDLTLKHPT